MSPDRRAYLDTSAVAKWYLNEPGSNEFVAFLNSLDVAVISSLTVTEMRSLLSRRRRMGELSEGTEAVLFAAFLDDIHQGWLQRYTVADSQFDDAVRLITRYPQHALRTLDALHLVIAQQAQIPILATADVVMAEAGRSIGFELVLLEGGPFPGGVDL